MKMNNIERRDEKEEEKNDNELTITQGRKKC